MHFALIHCVCCIKIGSLPRREFQQCAGDVAVLAVQRRASQNQLPTSAEKPLGWHHLGLQSCQAAHPGMVDWECAILSMGAHTYPALSLCWVPC